MNSTAKLVRLQKEKQPGRYCADERCLWRTEGGTNPCPKHPIAGPRLHAEWSDRSSCVNVNTGGKDADFASASIVGAEIEAWTDQRTEFNSDLFFFRLHARKGMSGETREVQLEVSEVEINALAVAVQRVLELARLHGTLSNPNGESP